MSASAPKAGGLSPAGFGIHRVLVKNSIQLSFGTMGAASRKMNRKMAKIAIMLLHPQRRMAHSVGFSSVSNRLRLRRRPAGAGTGSSPRFSAATAGAARAVEILEFIQRNGNSPGP